MPRTPRLHVCARACALYVGRLTPRLVSLGVRVIPSLLHTTHTQTHTLDTYIDRMGIFENFWPITLDFIMPTCKSQKSYRLSQVRIDPYIRMLYCTSRCVKTNSPFGCCSRY